MKPSQIFEGKNSSLRKAYEIATAKSKEVVDSLINGRKKRYIEAEDYSLHPNRTFDTY